MTPTRLTQTLRVPAAQWTAVITAHLGQLGTPTKILPATASSPLTATEVVWGSGATELRCLKENASTLIPNGDERFLTCRSNEEALAIFADLVKAGMPIRDNKRLLKEYAVICGKLECREVLLASVYIPQTTKALRESDTLGVIHNPNYPDSSNFLRLFSSVIPRPYAKAFSYGLVGVVGAVLATWLGQRSRR